MDEEQLRADRETIRAHRMGRRRVRVGPAVPPGETVLHVVPEDVPDRIRNLSRAREGPRVEPVRKDLAAEAAGLVEAPGHAYGEALHSSLQGKRVLRLDDEMDVVPLHAEMNDADPEPLFALPECFLDRAEAPRAPQARTPAAHSHRHVHRSAPRLFPRDVRHARPRSFRLAPCPFALPSPTPELDRKLLHPASLADEAL